MIARRAMRRRVATGAAGVIARTIAGATAGATAMAVAASLAVMAAAAVSGADRAAAQDWVNPDVIALREEVARLQREVDRMRAGAAVGASSDFSGGGAPAASGDVFIRLDQLETEMRRLLGRVERLEFAQRERSQAQSGELDEIRFRLRALETGDPTGGYSAATGGAPALGAASGESGGRPTEAPGGFDAAAAAPRYEGEGGSSFGAPPRTLGQIPGGSNAGAPIVDTPRYESSLPASPAGAAPSASAGGAPSAGGFAATPGGDQAYQAALDSLRAGAFDRAERDFSAFIQSNPNDPRVGEATYWLGETFYVRASTSRPRARSSTPFSLIRKRRRRRTAC